MKKTVGLVALVAVGLLATLVLSAGDSAAGKSSSTRPPRDLKLVGDHWTPWSPPPAKPEDYIIQRGDTFWDLGQKWLGNPFLWPQIWDQNRYVLDSHWIYPGDPLVQPAKPTVVPPGGPPVGEVGGEGEGEAAAQAAVPGPSAATSDSRKPARRLLPLAWGHDVYCSGYIDASHDYSDVWVAGREKEHLGASIGDVIYLSRGRSQGVEPGMDYAIVRTAWPVVHPASGLPLGEMIQRLGKVRVLCAQDETAMAVIVEACEPIMDSDELVPWRDIPIPAVASTPPFDRYCAAPSGGPQGYVVAVKDRVSAVGTGHIIHADLGEATGVQPGQFLTIYRENGVFPRIMIGQAMVLTVENGTCTAKVTKAIRELESGDRVEAIR